MSTYQTVPRLYSPWRFSQETQRLRYAVPAMTASGIIPTATEPVDAAAAAEALFDSLDEVLPQFVGSDLLPKVMQLLREHPVIAWMQQFLDSTRNKERLAAANMPATTNTTPRPQPRKSDEPVRLKSHYDWVNKYLQDDPAPPRLHNSRPAATRQAPVRPAPLPSTPKPSRSEVCKAAQRHATLHGTSFEQALDTIENRGRQEHYSLSSPAKPSRADICERAKRHAILHRTTFEQALDIVSNRVA